jgi:predicted RNase H-like HicB family nuclease
MSQVFSAIITEEDDMFVISNPDTGVTTQGKNLDDAVNNLKEALGLYFEEAGTSKKLSASHSGKSFLTTITL